MRVFFANLTNMPELESHPRHFLPPLDIGYCSSLLRQEGYEVAFYDTSVQKSEGLIREIRKVEPDILILKVSFEGFELARKLARELEVEVAAMGGLPTFMPGKFQDFDYILPGEADAIILDFLKRPEEYKEVRSIPLVKDLDSLPFPDHSLFLDKKYNFVYPTGLGKRLKFGFVQSSRGCPYNCIFCTPIERSSFGKKWRGRSPENVLEEILFLVSKGVNFVYFVDDLFTFDEKRVEKFCGLLRKEKLDLHWAVQSRVDRLNSKLLKEMRSAGCTTLCLGVESGSDKVLRKLRKGFNAEQSIKVSKLAKSFGFRLVFFLMLGNPAETREDIEKTFQMVKSINPDMIQIAFFTPYPGSPYFEKIGGENDIFSRHELPPKKFGELEVDELLEERKRFYRKFYLDPKFIFSFLRREGVSYLLNADHFFPVLRKTLKLLGPI